MILAERLLLPAGCRAILWDMDGVLLDSLGLDLVVCNQLLGKHFGADVRVSRSFLRSIFAYHPPEFWRMILDSVGQTFDLQDPHRKADEILAAYNDARTSARFEACPGVREILEDARRQGISSLVVSNNPSEQVGQILYRAGLADFFEQIIGNDASGLRKKPAPDTYLLAAQKAGLDPARCLVVEDSLLGAEAGRRAGCCTIGVATGGTAFEQLEASPWTHAVYSSFRPNRLSLQLGDVTRKEIRTPNEFVSHMIEHIAWRVGCEIELDWNNNDWFWLGQAVGQKAGQIDRQSDAGAALGMIDDGSAEVFVQLSPRPGLALESLPSIDLDWFLSCRCEQLDCGQGLVALLKGFAEGFQAEIRVRLCTLEDPHHSWEGVFRSVGISVAKMVRDDSRSREFPLSRPAPGPSEGALRVHQRSLQMSRVSRETAESKVEVTVDFSRPGPSSCQYEVSPSVNVAGAQRVIELFGKHAGCSIQVLFQATKLSSSHVALEDTALVLGRALKEVLTLRMEGFGINCAGSSLDSIEAEQAQPIRAAVSVEGRKFWRFVPFAATEGELKREMIIGHTVFDGLYSEDLDDFIDGLAGGLCCSIVIHVQQLLPPEPAWTMVFENLGKAVREAFAMNRRRKGVPSGVKATLA